MKFTTEQFRALRNACDHRAEALTKLSDAGSKAAMYERAELLELAHSFSCMLSMIKESEERE